MKSKAYRTLAVNQIEIEALLQDRDEKVVHAGLDVGKELIFCTLRWSNGDFGRGWRARNPLEVVRLAELLREVGRGRA